MSYENCSEEIFEGEGKYDIPVIEPVYKCNVKDWTIFEDCRNRNNEDAKTDLDIRNEKGVHFFQDDHKFDIVWSQPHKHLDRLKAYGCVLSPDFSMYTDFPVAVQIMQHYKKHWVARWWQEQGLTVIPTICWSTPDSYEWCFDGEPHESIMMI